MRTPCNSLYKVPVGGTGETKNVPDSHIPGGKYPNNLWGVQVPHAAPIECSSIDVREVHHDIWRDKVQLLQQGVYLSNQLPPLHHTVPLHAVTLLQNITKVLYLVNPGEGISIQDYWGHIDQAALHLGEDDTLGFRLGRSGLALQI